MTNLQSLSVFVTERLTLAAQEIFKAVEVTVTEYHEEISRSRQENELLKRRLLEAGIDFYSELQPSLSDVQESETGIGPPVCGEPWDQQSEKIHVKLELSAAQEATQDPQAQVVMTTESISPKPCLQSEQKMEDLFRSQATDSSMDALLPAASFMQIKEEPGELVPDLRLETFCETQTSVSADPSAAVPSSHCSGFEDQLDSHRLASVHKAVRSKIMLGKRSITKTDNHPVWKKSTGQQAVKPYKEKEENRGGSVEDKHMEIGAGGKRAYKVLGRLTVQGKHYLVDSEEVKRRVKGENMSANVFRALIRVARRHLPTEVLQQPKKAKTKVTIFSALTEGEAQDLAEGFGMALVRHVPRDRVLEGVPKHDIPATHRTIQRMRQNFQSLGAESDFDLTTHRFGPSAAERFFSFLEDSMQ